MATQLYDSESQAIYPNTQADAVSVDTNKTDINNVQLAIQDLYTQIAKLNGDQAAVSNLTFEISYLVSKISDAEQIKNEKQQWSTTFQLPTADKPYAWKRTIIGYTGIADADRKSVYEIVTADIAEINQSLYIAMDNTKTPRIYYPQAYREDNTPYDNLQASIKSIIEESKNNKDNPMVWSESPVSISASTPYGYVATRIRKNGTWTRFVIGLNSKWSYDSKMIVKYALTPSNSSPDIDRTNQDPGDNWSDQVTGTGYLWMITATRVSTNYAKDDQEHIWSAPQLISVIQ